MQNTDFSITKENIVSYEFYFKTPYLYSGD
jgi:hypothetical protein